MRFREDIFNNFIRLNRGFDLPDANLVDGSYPVVASTSIKAYHKESRVKGPGVVTGRSGSLGVVQYIATEHWPLNTALYVKDFKGNHPKFVFYFLQQMHLENFNSGAGVPTLNQNHLHKLKINIPELITQQKIAVILSAYDDLIENNQRRIALLEKMAEEIYHEWFVRLRFPCHEKVKTVKGVPTGWEIKKLGAVLELCYGKALKDGDRVPGEFHVYGSSGVVGTHNEALVKTPSLVVGRKGNVGSVYWPDRGFFPIDTVYFVKSELPNSFLYFLLRSMNFLNNDAAVPGLNRNQAYSNLFFLPPTPLVKKYAEVADANFEMKRLFERQNEKLVATRDLLLPRLISGKLSVENLDIQFPPSMKEPALEA